MMNLILTPVYKSYEIGKECCEAIDKYSVYPFLHILVDDDSRLEEAFPVQASEKRRILMMKRDYAGVIHKNGGGQAIQLGLDWARQRFFNEKPNPVFDNVFLIEADVIVQEEWDKKMLEVKGTLPEDWLTLDLQSIDKEGNLTAPTTQSSKLGYERDDLEIMQYPDFQVTLFNPKIFEAGVKFSDLPSHFDIMFGKVTSQALNGRHFRTRNVFAYHYFYSSRQFLSEEPIR